MVKIKDIHFRINKELLGSVFPSVEETVIHNSLLFHEATPTVNYIASMFPSLNIPDDFNLYI